MKRVIKINGEEFEVRKNNGLYSLRKGYGVMSVIDLENDKRLTNEEINSLIKENVGEAYTLQEDEIDTWTAQYGNKLFLFEDPIVYFFTLEEIEKLEDEED